MRSICKACAIISLLLAGVASGCPIWLFNATGHCECGEEILFELKVTCHNDERKVDIRAGVCVAFDYDTKSVLMGYCSYGYRFNMTNRMYSSLPDDPTQLNKTTCGPYNREGLFCGNCIEGFGPAVYSYDLRCANCTDISTGYAIILYLLLEFLPITLFFLFFAIFHVNITSGPILGYVIFCQAWTNAVQSNIYLYDSIVSHVPLPLAALAHVSVVLADIWNLHFFRIAVPAFCLSDKMTGIQVHMLNFLSAVYPVLLMAIAYIIIELPSRNNRVIWKPLCIYCAKLKNYCSASDSVIHAFATFIMLSSYTLIYNTRALFTPSHVHYINGTRYKTLTYDSSITMYCPEHIAYLVVAVVICFPLVVCPALILCLYPTRVYGILSRCSARKRIALKIFVEALHSCFKNGLNGTRDYRPIAGFIIIAPLLYGIVLVLVIKIHINTDIVMGFLFFILSFTVSYIRPCKSLIMNLSFSFHMMLLGILSVNGGLWAEDFATSTEVLAVSFVLLPVISHTFILAWVGYKITNFVILHCGCSPKTATTVFRKAVQSLWRRLSYERLHDVVTLN